MGNNQSIIATPKDLQALKAEKRKSMKVSLSSPSPTSSSPPASAEYTKEGGDEKGREGEGERREEGSSESTKVSVLLSEFVEVGRDDVAEKKNEEGEEDEEEEREEHVSSESTNDCTSFSPDTTSAAYVTPSSSLPEAYNMEEGEEGGKRSSKARKSLRLSGREYNESNSAHTSSGVKGTDRIATLHRNAVVEAKMKREKKRKERQERESGTSGNGSSTEKSVQSGEGGEGISVNGSSPFNPLTNTNVHIQKENSTINNNYGWKKLTMLEATKEKKTKAEELMKERKMRGERVKGVDEKTNSALIRPKKITREYIAAVRIQAVFRGWRARRVYKKLTYRTSVVREMLITELDYVRYLSVMVKVYYKPLMQNAAFSKSPIITQAQIKNIFPQIESIQMYNDKLLDMLQKKMREWSYLQTVGDVFLTMADFLQEPYTQYISQFPKISEQIKECMANPSFSLFIEKSRKYTECASMDLLSLASMPFQRIPRYTLLLKEVMKHTEKKHKDHDLLRQSVKKMEKLATLANEKLRDDEATKGVLQVSKLLDPPVQNLVKPYRKLVRGGDIVVSFTATSITLKKAIEEKCRRVYLFNDCVLLTDVPKKKMFESNANGHQKFKPLVIVDIEKAVLLDVENPETEFRIRAQSGTIIFQAPNWPEKEAWMDDILSCITSQAEQDSPKALTKTQSTAVITSTLRIPKHTLRPTRSGMNIGIVNARQSLSNNTHIK